MMEDQMIPTAEILDKQIQLARLQQENDPAALKMKLITVEQNAKFALTPVGQELKRFETLQRMGQMYAQSTIVPDTYKGSVPNCAIALDMATRMNANPVMVMQNLYIVHGNPAWSSKFLIATINTCGRFKTLRYRFYEDGTIGKVDYWDSEWVEEGNRKTKKNVKKTFDGSKIPNLVCVAYTTEVGSDEMLESTPVSCRMAVEEGWWTKNQSKWPTMTRMMLTYRAAAFWQRMYAPEISMGFMTQEEVEDVAPGVTDVEAMEVEAPIDAKSIRDIAWEKARAMKAETQAEATKQNSDTTMDIKAETQASEKVDEKQQADPSIAAHRRKVMEALSEAHNQRYGTETSDK